MTRPNYPLISTRRNATMTIARRIERLEAANPEHPVSATVVFTHKGNPVPDVVPPLRPNEMLIAVNFISSGNARNG